MVGNRRERAERNRCVRFRSGTILPRLANIGTKGEKPPLARDSSPEAAMFCLYRGQRTMGAPSVEADAACGIGWGNSRTVDESTGKSS